VRDPNPHVVWVAVREKTERDEEIGIQNIIIT
jgi:hypothetical protein